VISGRCCCSKLSALQGHDLAADASPCKMYPDRYFLLPTQQPNPLQACRHHQPRPTTAHLTTHQQCFNTSVTLMECSADKICSS